MSLASPDVSVSVAAAITVVGGALGAALDKVTGHNVIVLFTVGLALGAAVAVLAVQRLHLFAAVVAVPLVWLVLVVAGAVLSHPGGMAYTAALDFTIKAPAVLIATGIAALTAVGRRLIRR